MQNLITSDPKTMLGKPTVAGTRITVELILEKLAAGETPEEKSRTNFIAQTAHTWIVGEQLTAILKLAKVTFGLAFTHVPNV